MNACSWKPTPVTLIDGTEVLCDSEEWRRECHARHLLRYPFAVPPGKQSDTRKTIMEKFGAKHGADAQVSMQALMDACEPGYVLSLANKAQRNAYVDMVRRYVGETNADHLMNRAIELHKARAAAA